MQAHGGCLNLLCFLPIATAHVHAGAVDAIGLPYLCFCFPLRRRQVDSQGWGEFRWFLLGFMADSASAALKAGH